MARHVKIVSIWVLILNLALTPVNAVYMGESAIGDQKVLTLAANKDSRNQFCSMAMLTDRIIVTAAHCMAAESSAGGKLRFDTSQIWVTQPGVDMSVDAISTRVKVSKVVLIPGYENFWDPGTNDRRTQRDDISFLFLDAPLVKDYSIQIATPTEIAQLKNSGGVITHYGYGLQEENKIDQRPYKLDLKVINVNDNNLDANKTIFTQEDGRALCPGDSGGPWYSDFNGVKKIVAVTVAAGGCRGNLNPRSATLGTLIAPYLQFMNEQWDKFLVEEELARKSQEVEAAAKKKIADDLALRILNAKKDGTYMQDSSACHARGVQAALQLNGTNGWVDYMPVEGWAEASNCDASHPVQPWNILLVSKPTELRWRIWNPGYWEAFTKAFIQNPPKVNQDPSLNNMTPTPKPTHTPTAKTSIVCVKGKLIKKITAVKPICPKGYTLKR